MNSNIYMQNILDHYHDPENYGVIEGANCHAEEHNALCGDRLEVFMVVDNGVVVDVKFQGEGCAISQAAMSMLSTELVGKSVDEVQKLNKEDIIELLGIELSPTRLKCALLSLDVVKKSL
jgi:nitrogen fixation NifU-like protein